MNIKIVLLVMSHLTRVLEIRLLWMARLLLLVGYNNSFFLDGFQFKMIILESRLVTDTVTAATLLFFLLFCFFLYFLFIFFAFPALITAITGFHVLLFNLDDICDLRRTATDRLDLAVES